MRNEIIILNLGCGDTRIPNSYGVDKYSKVINSCIDVSCDLNQTPYPFLDNSIDEIHLYHVLEHLDCTIIILEEIYRILKSAGMLYIRVPHFSSMGAFTDITHKRPFGFASFDCFDKSNKFHYYTNACFEIMTSEIKYFGQYPNTGIYEKYIHENACCIFLKPIVRIFNFLINLSPVFFERFWCYYIGGACEVSFIMKKI